MTQPPPAPPPPPPGAPPPPPPPSAMPPPPAPTQQWYSLRGLTTALTVLLIAGAIGAVAGVAAFANRVGVADDILDRNFTLDLVDRADDADSFVQTIILLFAAIWLAIAVLTIIWTFRAMKNNEALGRTDSRFTPGWGIAGWLIPCANFVIPILIFQDLWRGSNPSLPRGAPSRGTGASPLLGFWWGTYLLSSIRFGFGSSNEANDRSELEDLKRSDTIALVGMVVTVAAAILFILVLRQLAERQEASLRAQQPAGAGPSASPAT